MSAVDPATVAKPQGWPQSLEWDPGLYLRSRERVAHLPPLTDEQVRRIAPLINAGAAATRALREATPR